MALKKRMVSFTEPQDKDVETESEKLGISFSDMNRRIIDDWRKRMGYLK